jgi:phosphatidylethanolamine N-methyltransferase
MWVPVHDEEWDGDLPLGSDRPPAPKRDLVDGQVVFKGNALPWSVGRYEVGHLPYILF